MALTSARILVIMGVASCGKTVTGTALARRLRVAFLDGDDFHPSANKAKMRAGTPLTDDDRWPWLSALALGLRDAATRDGRVVGACSALRRVYRDYLIAGAGEPILFVHLDGGQSLLAARIAARAHEYMPASLLDSQFATLEPPGPDENALSAEVTQPVKVIVDRLVMSIGAHGTPRAGS